MRVLHEPGKGAQLTGEGFKTIEQVLANLRTWRKVIAAQEQTSYKGQSVRSSWDYKHAGRSICLLDDHGEIEDLV